MNDFELEGFPDHELYGDVNLIDEAFLNLGFRLDQTSLVEEQFVMEGYVGNTKETDQIERACKSLCARYHGAGLVDTALADIHKSSELRDIERAIEELTGFRRVDIVVFNTADLSTATVPKSRLVRAISNDMPTCPTQHGKRYYDASHSYYCFIAVSAFVFTELEADEVTAILLHEVGHNFDVTLTYWIFDLYMWLATVGIGLSRGGVVGLLTGTLVKIFTPEIVGTISNILAFIEKFPPIAVIRILFTQGIRGFMILLGPLGIYTRLIRMLQSANPANFFRVNQETFADSYVSSLGYSGPLISVFNKIDQRDTVTRYGVLAEAWTGAPQAAVAILGMFLGEYPEMQTRCKIILEDMKRHSEDPNMPPHLKKAIKADYQNTKKAYDQFLQADPDERNSIVTRFARNAKERIFNGKCDLRSLIVGCSALDTH